MTPNITEEPTSTPAPSATPTTPSSNTTPNTHSTHPRPCLPTSEDSSPCRSEPPQTSPDQQTCSPDQQTCSPDQQTCSPALSSSTSASSLHPHVGSKLGYAILAIILILGWVTVMALLIFKEMWQLVLLGWLLFYAAAHFCYWFYKRNTSVTLQQQLRLRLVSHFRPGSPFKPNDHPPAYEDVMKSEPPPPSYFSVISEVPHCSSDPPPAYPSPARPIASARRIKKHLRRIPSAAGSISALPPPVEVEAQPKVLVAARASSSSSSSTGTAISYLSTNSSPLSSPVGVPVHASVQRSVSQFCDDMTSELRHVGTTGTDNVVVHISSSPTEGGLENNVNSTSSNVPAPPLPPPPYPQGNAPSSPSSHRGVGGDGDGDTESSDSSSNTSSTSASDTIIKVSSECITLEEYELKSSANNQLVVNSSISNSAHPDHRQLEGTSDSLTEVTERYSQSETQPTSAT